MDTTSSAAYPAGNDRTNDAGARARCRDLYRQSLSILGSILDRATDLPDWTNDVFTGASIDSWRDVNVQVNDESIGRDLIAAIVPDAEPYTRSEPYTPRSGPAALASTVGWEGPYQGLRVRIVAHWLSDLPDTDTDTDTDADGVS